MQIPEIINHTEKVIGKNITEIRELNRKLTLTTEPTTGTREGFQLIGLFYTVPDSFVVAETRNREFYISYLFVEKVCVKCTISINGQRNTFRKLYHYIDRNYTSIRDGRPLNFSYWGIENEKKEKILIKIMYEDQFTDSKISFIRLNSIPETIRESILIQREEQSEFLRDIIHDALNNFDARLKPAPAVPSEDLLSSDELPPIYFNSDYEPREEVGGMCEMCEDVGSCLNPGSPGCPF